MKKEEAKQIIINICQNVRGTLSEHAKIQEALKILGITQEEVRKKDEKNK